VAGIIDINLRGLDTYTAKVKAAGPVAARATQGEALARKPASSIGVKLSGGNGSWVLRGTGPLAHLLEGGTRPHEESTLYAASGAVQSGTFSGGKKAFQALNRRTTTLNRSGYGANYAFKFRTDGRYVRGTIHHPGMDAQPFIHPAGAMFPAFYIAAARGATRSFGVSAIRGFV